MSDLSAVTDLPSVCGVEEGLICSDRRGLFGGEGCEEGCGKDIAAWWKTIGDASMLGCCEVQISYGLTNATWCLVLLEDLIDRYQVDS